MNAREAGRLRRKKRIRKTVSGTSDRPRLCVFRSLRHIYAQVIDDEAHRVVATASTLSPAVRGEIGGLKKVEQAKKVGARIAGLCKERGVVQVAFDRGGFRYHGRVKALAEAARQGGLAF